VCQVQQTTTKPKYSGPNRFAVFNDTQDPEAALQQLREEFDKKNPTATDELREHLRELCKARTITPELRKELHKLGFEKSILQVPNNTTQTE